MEKLVLNIYDDEDNVVKTSEAKIIDLRFGTVRNLMELLNVDDIDDTSELFKTVFGAWSQLTKLLDKVFPDVDADDWENVKLSELIPILVFILKSSFIQMLDIPTDKEKNSEAE